MALHFSLTDNTKQVIDAKDAAVQKALEMIGLKCEGYAKLLCPVDTGLLRNSITHAVSGHGVASTSYHADRDKGGVSQIGRYSGGTMGSDKSASVIVGTNVEYAPYVEFGTSRQKAQPYLRPAVNDHAEEYKNIALSCLKA